MEDHVFVPRGSLADYGIDFDVRPDPTKADKKYQSKSGVELTFQAEADVQKIPEVPQGKAGLSIKFGKEAGIVFALKGGVENRMASEVEMRRRIIELAEHDPPDFPLDYA